MFTSIDIDRERIGRFCEKWKIEELSLFGSVLREDFGSESDIDVLVRFEPVVPWSLYDWVDMIDELREIFGRDVDPVEESGLRNPFRRRSILTTKKTVYASKEG